MQQLHSDVHIDILKFLPNNVLQIIQLVNKEWLKLTRKFKCHFAGRHLFYLSITNTENCLRNIAAKDYASFGIVMNIYDQDYTLDYVVDQRAFLFLLPNIEEDILENNSKDSSFSSDMNDSELCSPLLDYCHYILYELIFCNTFQIMDVDNSTCLVWLCKWIEAILAQNQSEWLQTRIRMKGLFHCSVLYLNFGRHDHFHDYIHVKNVNLTHFSSMQIFWASQKFFLDYIGINCHLKEASSKCDLKISRVDQIINDDAGTNLSEKLQWTNFFLNIVMKDRRRFFEIQFVGDCAFLLEESIQKMIMAETNLVPRIIFSSQFKWPTYFLLEQKDYTMQNIQITLKDVGSIHAVDYADYLLKKKTENVANMEGIINVRLYCYIHEFGRNCYKMEITQNLQF